MAKILEKSEFFVQLVQQERINKNAFDQALLTHGETGDPLEDVLIKQGLVTEEEFYKLFSDFLKIDYVRLGNITIPPAVMAEIPAKFACHYEIMPIKIDGKSLTVASSKPLNVHILDDLRLLLKKNIKVALSTKKEIADAIKKYYGVGAETIDKISSDLSQQRFVSVQSQETQDLLDSSDDASITKFVNQILLEAYKDRATDIHIEPYENKLVVRYRIDGILYDTKVPQTIKKFQSAIISRIKIMANLNIAEQRLPQDGRIKVKIDEDEVDLRVSILPTPFGEGVVIRVLSRSEFLSLDNFGLLKKDLDILERMVKKQHGIIFVTGPTGSGKTTTLYAVLNKINDKDKKIITIEDPIEYQIEGVMQIQVQPKIDFTFANALRSMLRHDPDVMMVGEVRDYETAEITVRVALTGHLVFSTLHTNNAAGGVTRLIEMGVEPFLVSSAVECFIAQRLVRVLCPHCKKQVMPSGEILKELGVQDKVTAGTMIYEPVGCESCRHTGYKGRTAIYEMLVMTDAIKELVLQRASSDQIKTKALSLGMRTLRQDGWEKVLSGVTTPSEVLRVTQQEELAE